MGKLPMRFFRAMLAVVLALLWVPITNSCLIASAWSENTSTACCDDELDPTGGEDGLPCRDTGCVPCAILKNGAPAATIAPLIVPPAIWKETTQFMEQLQRLAQMEIAILLEPTPAPSPIPPPAWQDDVKTALPVRGPSLVA